MEKEQVVEKLVEVFEVVADCIIKRKGNTDANTLAEVKNLGEAIIRARQNIATEVHKAEHFIEQKVNIALQRKSGEIADKIKKELSNSNNNKC